MLRQDKKAKFTYRHAGFWANKLKWTFRSGNRCTEGELSDEEYHQIKVQQKKIPVKVMYAKSDKKTWWMFQDEFYWDDENYTAEDIRILVLDRIEQKRKKLERAKSRLTRNKPESCSGREPIPDDVKMFVWQRDEGQCIKCGSKENLEYDHIIPVSKGGSNTERNLQLLCETCNRSKGANLF